MTLTAILDEVDQLQNVGTRLEGLAEHHPPVTEALITIAGNIRNTATLLAVLVATKLHRRRRKEVVWLDVRLHGYLRWKK